MTFLLAGRRLIIQEFLAFIVFPAALIICYLAFRVKLKDYLLASTIGEQTYEFL